MISANGGVNYGIVKNPDAMLSLDDLDDEDVPVKSDDAAAAPMKPYLHPFLLAFASHSDDGDDDNDTDPATCRPLKFAKSNDERKVTRSIVYRRSASSKHKRKTPIMHQCTWPHCSKTFVQRQSLHRHVREQHERQRLHVCHAITASGPCNRTFSQRSHLKSHALTHTRTRPYACSECHARFKQVSTLVQHRRSWHPSKYSIQSD